MIIEFEGKVSDEHRVKQFLISFYLFLPVMFHNLVFAAVNDRPYLGLFNYILLGINICIYCVIREDILWYRLYKTVKELEKC